jgi:uncharacterized protein
MSNETVLITGASSGIGRELARLFAADGAELILVARREHLLNELAVELRASHGAETTVIPLDLSRPDAPQQLHERLADEGREIDVLVNNAGFGQLGRFQEISLDRQLRMIQVNVASLMHLTHLFLPGMLERKRGAILNLGSTAAFQPGPNSAVYYATKAFVLSFSEALFSELKGTGVAVTCLCPGPTTTGFGDDSGMQQTRVFRLNSMPVEAVAQAGFRGVRRRKRLVIPGLWNRILSTSVRFTPRSAILEVMQFLQSSRGRS